jgi:hypothetical protein
MALLKKSGSTVRCSPALAFSLIGFAAVLFIYFQTKVVRNATPPTDEVLASASSSRNTTDAGTSASPLTHHVQTLIITTHDDNCKRMFDWSMIDQWKTNDPIEVDYENLPQTKHLKADRMGGPSATGVIEMKIVIRNQQINLTVVNVGKFTNDQMSDNLWHRSVPVYGSWVGVQFAQRKYNLTLNRIVYVFDCNKDRKFEDIPPEWKKMGEVSCDAGLIEQADVLIEPPTNGLLWDLAWDMNFECYSSDMFKTFVSQFVDKSSKLDPPDPLACWISRQGRGLRSASNFNEVMGVMKEVFTNARELRFTKAMSVDDVANTLNDCRVIFGIHGAGHMNALFARPGVAVIEIVGKDNPAYFRNINMLLGQNYQRIVGDATRGIQDDGYVIDLEEAREALMKARDHAASWIEEHGHWR